ncbi:putative ammonium transporter 1 [Eurytemora carolleeae]|uniref:putative ammonium transporter 1 n=1 Tax=Eurytemora carolleeae TaxID=1294199 RepID=UPI000C770A92|nr:putative ammonium transporter 1 [Eurytemora carolleeae]|eukprot:XP_023345791.1 putative ammonium transporter 1 [Eurytemora affinis]
MATTDEFDKPELSINKLSLSDLQGLFSLTSSIPGLSASILNLTASLAGLSQTLPVSAPGSERTSRDPRNMTHAELQDLKFENLEKNTDHFFLIIIAIIIFFMQGGFAFLEAGAVRSKNTVNILIKNLLDIDQLLTCFIVLLILFYIICIQLSCMLKLGFVYWAIGWGLAYGAGGNPFCGGSQFLNYHLDYDSYPTWFFQFVFAASAATIVSGAIAERCQFGAYFLYSILITGWVYPVVSHWTWDTGDEQGVGQGWLNSVEYTDFAGSGVVHLLGASCALVGCSFIGARKGRFNVNGDIVEMAGHSVPLAGLGGFILLFGFLAFNGGSQGSISRPGDGAAVALSIVNTILGACSGGLCVLLFNRFLLRQPWSFLMTLNGSLAGMVAMCAGCNVYEPWAALVIGTGAGVSFITIHFIMLKLQLDDPLDAVAVHGGGGLWGLVSVPFFMYANLEEGKRGIFWDGHTSYPWIVLGYNLLGALCIFVWAAFWSILIFGGARVLGWLRVSEELELKGMDIDKHGEAAYPAQAWVEVQYKPKPGIEDSTPQYMAFAIEKDCNPTAAIQYNLELSLLDGKGNAGVEEKKHGNVNHTFQS